MADTLPCNLPLSQLLAELHATHDGLNRDEAERRLIHYGPNDALLHRRRSLWRQVLGRFSNPLILILLFASGLSAWTGEVTSFVLIVGIILLSVVLDVVQQARAENTVDALRRSVGLKAEVLRDGKIEEVTVDRLVPGDVVELKAGDIVPGDCRLIAARDLFVNQALLTGEAYPAEKEAADLSPPVEQPGQAVNFLCMGTAVISGIATALVVHTGRATELGGLVSGLAMERPRDAFEQGIRQFGYLMLRLTVFLVLFVTVTNLAFHRPLLESLLFALALAVGLTPELLPMVVTVTLANGARRLATRRVIVKRLAAIHDLGAMDVLCTDKTGTLTESEIKLAAHVDQAGKDSSEVLKLAALNSYFQSGIKSPLDAAILADRKLDTGAWQKLDEIPFDFERRRVSVLLGDGRTRLLVVKGAPEEILARSAVYLAPDGERPTLDSATRTRLLERFESWGEEGYRVLGVASSLVQGDAIGKSDEDELVFAGFALFVDPPKCDAADAVRALAESGVEVKILSGDNEHITRHICTEIGVPVHGVLTGQEIARLSDEALQLQAESANLFCRVTPQQKQRIMLALKRAGRVVGFLGDGINDASALHGADVGISVDNAADVAKEAADLVLLERDLSVVHDGIIEGRRTVENVTKYILMGSSSNFGNMFSMAGAALFLPFLPMLPPQVLLNNLLYDVSEVGVPFDNVDEDALKRPVHWDIGFIERFMLVLGPVSSLFDFLTFFALLSLFGAGEAMFQTGWFIESLATQCFVIFVIRTRGVPWRSRPHPLLTGLTLGAVGIGLLLPLTPLGKLLGFVEPPPGFYLFLLCAVSAYLLLVEIVKRHLYRRPDASSGRALASARARRRQAPGKAV
jgi:Mg2+-importing ATPase